MLPLITILSKVCRKFAFFFVLVLTHTLFCIVSCTPPAPKQSRPCVCLAWHEQDTSLLAIGHDRNRSDHCITIWDTERGLAKDKAMVGLSETAHSMCWDRQSRILIAGMSLKYIKIIDFRRKFQYR